MGRLSPSLGSILLGLSTSLISAALFAVPQRKARPPADPNQLATILARCADYCERLESSVLNFICVETIKEEIFQPRVEETNLYTNVGTDLRVVREIVDKRIAKNEYVYDYMLVRKAGRTEERRTLVQENGRKRREANARLKTSGFSYENIIFGPIVLLGKKWQPKHNYEILREEKIQGRKAVVIKATPKPGEWVGYLYGTIWVGKDDHSILRIAWSQESIENYKPLREFAADLNIEPDIVLTGEYGYEKNSIRFPSRFSIHEAYLYAARTKRFTYYKLNAVLNAYKFFTVETEVRY